MLFASGIFVELLCIPDLIQEAAATDKNRSEKATWRLRLRFVRKCMIWNYFVNYLLTFVIIGFEAWFNKSAAIIVLLVSPNQAT